MKKTISLIISLICLLSLSACFNLDNTPDQTPTESNDKGNVSPTTVSSPIHFRGINENTFKEDVRNIYGVPSEIFENERSEEYNLSFLDINGRMLVTYMNNSDKIFLARFFINSKDFESFEAYQTAVNKTIAHFEISLIHLENKTSVKDGKTIYEWHNEEAEYAYTIYYTQTINKDENGNSNWDDLSDTTVFQFNRYSIIDSE